jgi:hypothetical protein
LAITTASGMIANADEFGTTTEENTLHTYLTSIGRGRPSAAPCLTGLRVPT